MAFAFLAFGEQLFLLHERVDPHREACAAGFDVQQDAPSIERQPAAQRVSARATGGQARVAQHAATAAGELDGAPVPGE